MGNDRNPGLPSLGSPLSDRRRRLLAAMAEACAARGYAATTVTDVVAAAQLTRDDFHSLFRDEEECFLASMDFALGEIMGLVSSQYSADKPWFKAVRDIVTGLTEFFSEHPEFAKITLLESLPAGSAAFERYNAAKRAIIILLEQGREDAPADLALPLSVGQIAFGGAEAVIKDELIAGRASSLPQLIPELLYVCYTPFMAQDQAISLSGIGEKRDVSAFAFDERPSLANIELPPASQRLEIMEAMLKVCVNDGYNEASVEKVIAEAGISRDDFYAHFTDKQSCFLATYDFLLDHVAFGVLSAFESEAEWPEQARAGVAALLDWFAAAPHLAHLAIVGMVMAGPAAHRHYRQAVRRFIPLIAAGRRYSPASDRLPPTVSRLALGSVTEILLDEIYAGRAARLSEMAPELTFAISAPLLGAEEASELMLKARAR